MSKSYFFLVIILVLLSGCSSDSESGGSGLVKEINSKTVNYDGTGLETNSKYFYNGNKLVSISHGFSHGLIAIDKYTYTGNLITSITQGDISITWLKYQYEYDSSDRLIKETTISYTNIPEDVKTYTYNADNSIIRKAYHGTVADPSQLYETVRIYVDSLNRFIKMEVFNGSNWAVKNEVTYTDYKSPSRNILGYDKLFLLMDTRNGFQNYTNYTNVSTFAYSVNGNGYPKWRIEENRSANGGLFSTTTNTYKY